MQGFYTHGPWCTYVTDPSLSLAKQQDVIERFVACSGDQNLRIAFRLPECTEAEVGTLMEWYLRLVDTHDAGMLPPLVHGRTDSTAQYPGSGRWLPSRELDALARVGTDDAWTAVSVHSYYQARSAVDAGAQELIYGHIFDTPSHPDQPAKGFAEFRRIADELRRTFFDPVITGIGGIDSNNASDIGQNRMFSVAMIRAISQSEDIAATLDRLRRWWLHTLIRADLDEPEPNTYPRPHSIFHRWTSDSDHYAKLSKEATSDE